MLLETVINDYIAEHGSFHVEVTRNMNATNYKKHECYNFTLRVKIAVITKEINARLILTSVSGRLQQTNSWALKYSYIVCY